MKILLVEDHPALARISCDLLRDVHGHDVRHAASGMAALYEAATFIPDLVLIDLNLPDMSGCEVASRLRSQGQFDETVLVALTGFGTALNDGRLAAAGFDALFRKPMDFDLLTTLRRQPAAAVAAPSPRTQDG